MAVRSFGRFALRAGFVARCQKFVCRCQKCAQGAAPGAYRSAPAVQALDQGSLLRGAPRYTTATSGLPVMFNGLRYGVVGRRASSADTAPCGQGTPAASQPLPSPDYVWTPADVPKIWYLTCSDGRVHGVGAPPPKEPEWKTVISNTGLCLTARGYGKAGAPRRSQRCSWAKALLTTARSSIVATQP